QPPGARAEDGRAPRGRQPVERRGSGRRIDVAQEAQRHVPLPFGGPAGAGQGIARQPVQQGDDVRGRPDRYKEAAHRRTWTSAETPETGRLWSGVPGSRSDVVWTPSAVANPTCSVPTG